MLFLPIGKRRFREGTLGNIAPLIKSGIKFLPSEVLSGDHMETFLC